MHTLQSAKAAWAAQHPPAYTIDQRWSCECGPSQYGKVRITVRNKQITKVINLQNGKPLPQDEWQAFSTVDELFEQVERFETEKPYQSLVQYSPRYDYLMAI